MKEIVEEENENNNINSDNSNQNIEEIELYNRDNEEDNLPLVINDQNNNIKIEEYESELNENKNGNNEKNDEYILNAIAKIKKKNKLKMKNNLQESSNKSNSNTKDQIVQTELENIEPINKRNNKLIYLTPIVNSCRVEKNDNISLDLKKSKEKEKSKEKYKFGINEEGNPVNLEKTNNNKIIAFIVTKKDKNEKNYLIDTKGNIIPKTKEGNYIYNENNEKDNKTKSIIIKEFDVQNPELRTNTHNNNTTNIKSEENDDSNHLKRNMYNKSNDDIKRILNIDNNNYTTENLIDYNNLMNIWRQRYGKKGQLYQKINSEYDLDYKRENNDKMVKRTNSILKMAEHNYISSFTDGNIDNNYNNYKTGKNYKYKTPIYYNGLINRKYSNPLLKKNNMTINNRFNPLLNSRTNKNILFRRKNNFTDILRARLNHSDDLSQINYNKNLSFEKLDLKGNNDKNKYNSNNILKNSLYKNILRTNREKEISKYNEIKINNNGIKKYSIINNNIFNIIRDTNNKRKKKFKYSVLICLYLFLI